MTAPRESQSLRIFYREMRVPREQKRDARKNHACPGNCKRSSPAKSTSHTGAQAAFQKR